MRHAPVHQNWRNPSQCLPLLMKYTSHLENVNTPWCRQISLEIWMLLFRDGGGWVLVWLHTWDAIFRNPLVILQLVISMETQIELSKRSTPHSHYVNGICNTTMLLATCWVSVIYACSQELRAMNNTYANTKDTVEKYYRRQEVRSTLEMCRLFEYRTSSQI